MNGSPPLLSLTQTRGGGPGDGLSTGSAAIRLGFCAEPIVDLVHGEVSALYSECLARMMVPENVLLTPGDFIGVLEARGDIALLDTAMLGLAFDALAADPRLCLGCNISPYTLADDDAWAWLVHRLRERASLASRLTLEITESCPLDEIAGAAERLRQAKQIGCRLAIDDFGSGFAASAHLHAVDVDWDIIKIDRGCFGDLRKSPSGRDGLRTFVQLAQCFAPIVVVEGIETREHLALARASGARFGQGWMFGEQARIRWTSLGGETGERLGAAFMGKGAILHPSDEPFHPGETAAPGRAGWRYLLSRVDHLSERVRALVARGRAGGVS